MVVETPSSEEGYGDEGKVCEDQDDDSDTRV